MAICHRGEIYNHLSHEVIGVSTLQKYDSIEVTISTIIWLTLLYCYGVEIINIPLGGDLEGNAKSSKYESNFMSYRT